MKSKQRPWSWLVIWYGSVQMLHFISLIRAGWIYLTQHEIGFPAPGPPAGWSEQAMHFLLALGITDALLILLSLCFVYAYHRQRPRQYSLGLLATGSSIVTALVFALGTLPSGAWLQNPISYGLITLLFIPFIGLFLQLWSALSRKMQAPTLR